MTPATEGSPDLSAAELARERDDVLSTRQLEQVGLDRFAVRRRVAKGLLRPVHAGVFALGPADLTPMGRMRAAELSCGPEVWLGHRSATVLWEFVDEWNGPVDVLLHRRHLERRGINVRRTNWLPEGHRATRHGLPVTSPARTILDVGTAVEPALHEHAIAAALRSRWVTFDQLGELAESGRPGSTALRAQLKRAGGPQFSRSEGERIVLRLCREARLPPPQVNERAHGAERDLLWPEARVVVEFDGFGFHWSPQSKRNDNRRDGDLALRGWRTVRLTWGEITEEPVATVARIAGALALGYAQ